MVKHEVEKKEIENEKDHGWTNERSELQNRD